MYIHVPDMIRFYLRRGAIPPTCRPITAPDDLKYVLDPPGGTGGEGAPVPGSYACWWADGKPGRDPPVPDKIIADPCGTSPSPPWPCPLPDLRRGRRGAAPRPAALRAFGKDINMVPAAHPRRPQGGIAGRQFVPGRRHQRHLGLEDTDMLSSTADHLYWMARHGAGRENTARMLDVTGTACPLCARERNRNPTIARNSLSIRVCQRNTWTAYGEVTSERSFTGQRPDE